MKNIVLFDLGGTLAYYYERSEFPDILRQAISEAEHYLRERGLLNVSLEEISLGVRKEDHDAEDYRVRPLEERLTRIFPGHRQSSQRSLWRKPMDESACMGKRGSSGACQKKMIRHVLEWAKFQITRI